MKLILVTGMPGSGKEELLRVADSSGIPYLRMGDAVRECYKGSDAYKRGLNVVEFADEERKQFGKDIWAKRTLQRMSSDMCLIDGCRSLDEIGCFRSMSDDMTVICVHAARKDRYDRIIARGREDVPESIEEFDQRDRKELEWGIGEIIALSDIVISNDSDLESFRDKIDHVFKTMGLI